MKKVKYNDNDFTIWEFETLWDRWKKNHRDLEAAEDERLGTYNEQMGSTTFKLKPVDFCKAFCKYVKLQKISNKAYERAVEHTNIRGVLINQWSNIVAAKNQKRWNSQKENHAAFLARKVQEAGIPVLGAEKKRKPEVSPKSKL
jgi:hypothetical protein